MEKTINFGKYETASFIANVFLIKIFSGLPGELSRASGTASWLSVMLSGVMFIIILALIFKLTGNNAKCDIFTLAEASGGVFLKKALAIIIFLSFLIKGAVLLRITAEITVSVLPFGFGVKLFLILISLSVLFSALFGLETVVRLHAAFLPLILLSFALVIFLAFFFGDALNLFPVFGFGAKNILTNSLKNIGVFSDIIYIFLLTPYVNDEKTYKKACFGGVILSASVITLVCLAYCFAAEYPLNATLFNPIFQMSRLISFGANSQGFEAFLLPVWIISMLLYLVSSAFFAAFSLKRAFNLNGIRIPAVFSSLLIFIISLCFENLEKTSSFGTKILNNVVIAVSLVCILTAFFAKMKRGEKNDEKI